MHNGTFVHIYNCVYSYTYARTRGHMHAHACVHIYTHINMCIAIYRLAIAAAAVTAVCSVDISVVVVVAVVVIFVFYSVYVRLVANRGFRRRVFRTPPYQLSHNARPWVSFAIGVRTLLFILHNCLLSMYIYIYIYAHYPFGVRSYRSYPRQPAFRGHARFRVLSCLRFCSSPTR